MLIYIYIYISQLYPYTVLIYYFVRVYILDACTSVRVCVRDNLYMDIIKSNIYIYIYACVCVYVANEYMCKVFVRVCVVRLTSAVFTDKNT